MRYKQSTYKYKGDAKIKRHSGNIDNTHKMSACDITTSDG